FYASSAQQLDRDVIITDDYDFSEVDVDLVDMISYGLSQPNKELSIAEQEILTDAAASPLPPAEYEAIPLTSTASSSPIEDSPPPIEIEVSLPTKEEASTSDSETQIPVDEEMPTSDTVTHDEEEIAGSDIAENITGDRAIVSIEQESESLVTSSSSSLEESKQEESSTEIPDTNLPAIPADENLTEEAQDE